VKRDLGGGVAEEELNADRQLYDVNSCRVEDTWGSVLPPRGRARRRAGAHMRQTFLVNAETINDLPIQSRDIGTIAHTNTL